MATINTFSQPTSSQRTIPASSSEPSYYSTPTVRLYNRAATILSSSNRSRDAMEDELPQCIYADVETPFQSGSAPAASAASVHSLVSLAPPDKICRVLKAIGYPFASNEEESDFQEKLSCLNLNERKLRILQAVLEIENPSGKVYLLYQLGGHPRYISRLMKIWEISNVEERRGSLKKLARFPKTPFDEAWEIAKHLKKLGCDIDLEMLKRFDIPLEEAISIADRITSTEEKSEAYLSILQKFSMPCDQALLLAKMIPNHEKRRRALFRIAEYAPADWNIEIDNLISESIRNQASSFSRQNAELNNANDQVTEIAKNTQNTEPQIDPITIITRSDPSSVPEESLGQREDSADPEKELRYFTRSPDEDD